MQLIITQSGRKICASSQALVPQSWWAITPIIQTVVGELARTSTVMVKFELWWSKKISINYLKHSTLSGQWLQVSLGVQNRLMVIRNTRASVCIPFEVTFGLRELRSPRRLSLEHPVQQPVGQPGWSLTSSWISDICEGKAVVYTKCKWKKKTNKKKIKKNA